MKMIHLSDLHLGRRLGEFPLKEDQEDILEKILKIVEKESPDAVLIAGDVYDRPIPPEEAVRLFGGFLEKLVRAAGAVFVISGNHDSNIRLAFGSRLMRENNVYFSSEFKGILEKVELTDEFGPVTLWMLPFIKPAHVGAFYNDIDHDDYTGAVARVVEGSGVDETGRNVLIAHQYVTGAERSESEDRVIGGLENVDGEVFAPFDYVALGHLHRSQKAAGEKIRYCGAPLQYSFGEAGEEKSILVVELREKGDLEVKTVPLSPLRKMTIQTGTFDELMSSEASGGREDFVRADLTDEEYIPDAIRQLRKVWPNILEITYPNISKGLSEWTASEETEEMSPLESLESFYRFMRGTDMSDEQEEMVERFIREIWEVEE